MSEQRENDGVVWNGLDPFIWGELAFFRISADLPPERECMLELLQRVQRLLTNVSERSNQSDLAVAAVFLHDDIASAAVHFEWWMDGEITDE